MSEAVDRKEFIDVSARVLDALRDEQFVMHDPGEVGEAQGAVLPLSVLVQALHPRILIVGAAESNDDITEGVPAFYFRTTDTHLLVSTGIVSEGWQDLAVAQGPALSKATNTLVDEETDDTAYMTVLKVYRAIDRKALSKATNPLVDAEVDDTAYVTVAKVFRAIARKVKTASKTVAGIVELANTTEIDGGTDDERAVTSAGLRRAVGPKVGSTEKSAGTETAVRRFSVKDVWDSAKFALASIRDAITPNQIRVDGANLAAWRERLQVSKLSVVHTVAVNTDIPATARGDTYRMTGNTARIVFLPDIAEVVPGFDVAIINDSAHPLPVTPDGVQTIDGNAGVSIPVGEAIRVQVVSGTGWAVTADTGKGAGGGADATARAAADAAAESAREAIGGVVSNAGRLSKVEHKTSDIDEVVDASTWGAAPAAEARITLIPPGSSLQSDIMDRTFDPSDLDGSEVWAGAVNTTAENDIVLLRLKNGLDNIRYRYTSDGVPEPILEHSRLPNADASWTYFNLGRFASGLAVVLQKRVDRSHTKFKGELGGRAIEQVDEEIADATSGGPTVPLGDARISLVQFGDGRAVWSKGEFEALRTVELNTPYDSARVGGYSAGSSVSYEGVNYTSNSPAAMGAFDVSKWDRDADQPTPYFQVSILTRLENASGLPAGPWVLSTRLHPDDDMLDRQWRAEESLSDDSRLELFQKDGTGHWVEPTGALEDGLLLFRFTIVAQNMLDLFRDTDGRTVIRDNIHFLLGKAFNFGNYTGLGVDVRITVGSQSQELLTPRLLPHLPQPMFEGEIVFLTEDDIPHPTVEQVYRFGSQASDFNPEYGRVFPGRTQTDRINVFGVALGGTFGGTPPQGETPGTNQWMPFGGFVPGIFRANGIHAIYVRQDYPERVYVRMARALVADAEVDTLKFRLGAYAEDSGHLTSPYTVVPMVPVANETTAAVRTFYAEPKAVNPNPSHAFVPYSRFVSLGDDTIGRLTFSMVKGSNAWLRYNSLTEAVDFTAGQLYQKGYYRGAGDGLPQRIYLPLAAVKQRFERAVGASPATLPVGTYELSVMLRVSNVANNDWIDHRILLSNIVAADRDFFGRGDSGSEVACRMRYNPTTRVLTYSQADSGQNGQLGGLKAIGEA